MEPLFEGLTSSEIEYLGYLKKRGYFDGIEMFMNLNTSSDCRVKKLEAGGYITLSNDGSCKVTVTGKGIAALVDYDKYQNQIQPLKDEIRVLNIIAESLRKQVVIAEDSAKESEKDSKFSKKLAIVSLIVSIIPLLPVMFDFISFVSKILLQLQNTN